MTVYAPPPITVTAFLMAAYTEGDHRDEKYCDGSVIHHPARLMLENRTDFEGNFGEPKREARWRYWTRMKVDGGYEGIR